MFKTGRSSALISAAIMFSAVGQNACGPGRFLAAGGKRVIRSEFHGQALAHAPDLLAGYAPGYRSSRQTALGAVPAKVIEDNTDE